jgi:hypothetical protein
VNTDIIARRLVELAHAARAAVDPEAEGRMRLGTARLRGTRRNPKEAAQ